MKALSRKGFGRIYHAVLYSAAGLVAAWRNEAAFRQEVVLALVLLPIAFWLGEDAWQTSLLMLPVFMVLITELLNTGLEAVVDRVGEERHELSRRAKDIGSAAVFVSFVALIATWGTVICAKFF